MELEMISSQIPAFRSLIALAPSSLRIRLIIYSSANFTFLRQYDKQKLYRNSNSSAYLCSDYSILVIYQGLNSSAEGCPYRTQGLLAGTLLIFFVYCYTCTQVFTVILKGLPGRF